jgi:3-hydroxyacyl-[acyl-carrier-protein] dehydratase
MTKADSKGLFHVRRFDRLTPGAGIEASGTIPVDLELYQDHFPDYPVLPGVLALEILIRSAQLYCRKVQGGYVDFRIQRVTSVKFTRFLKPGDEWMSHLRLLRESGPRMLWKAELKQDGKRAVSAEIDVFAYNGNTA